MSVQTWTYVIVGITFALYIGIAIWSKASSTKDFYVAGGGVSPWANGMATAADWMSVGPLSSKVWKIYRPRFYRGTILFKIG